MGNYSDWWRFTAIELYAEQYGIAVVMPSADNSFYANVPTGRYFDYITSELPQILQSMLPLSASRADNIVAGLSMGGHGAYKLGLSKPEQYVGIGVFSAGNFIELGDMPAGSPYSNVHKYVFGTTHLIDLIGTEHDIKHLAETAAHSGKELPKLFVCCGTEDGGFHVAETTYHYLNQTLGYEGVWKQGSGIHDWKFWNEMLPDLMAWCKQVMHL
jgi:S-formylglutathione hydrolase FrmB